MKMHKAVRAIAGVLLCAVGFWLAVPTAYRERTYVIDASGCRLETTVVEKSAGAAQGSVVLLHGLSANKKIMSYLARGLAEQGLRVYVPDLPGHGRTPGPFSAERAEKCGEALVRELLARVVIRADRTILAGHSMGGAIAVRIASRVSLAGVIAMSPAPMRAAHGVRREMLLFSDPPPLAQNSLIVSGSLEPESMRGNASDLAASGGSTVKYLEIPRASHVSLLFSSAAARALQAWCAQVLHFAEAASLPSHGPLAGALAGFFGLVLLAGPFLREVVGKKKSEETSVVSSAIPPGRLILEFTACSALAVMILRFWIALKAIRLFEGDYFASFFLLVGVMLIAMHWSAARPALGSAGRRWAAGALAGIVLLVLVTAWFDLTFYEAWLTAAKWLRFPFLVLALLPYHFAEEALLGSVRPGKKWGRFALALLLRLIGWGTIMGGIYVLHSGEVLMGLLAIYMGLFHILQKSGMDIVREESGSTAATAVFGAILQAGFCLVIFPLN